MHSELRCKPIVALNSPCGQSQIALFCLEVFCEVDSFTHRHRRRIHTDRAAILVSGEL